MDRRQGKSRENAAQWVRLRMKVAKHLGVVLLILACALPHIAHAQSASMASAPVSVLTVPVGQSLLMRYPNAKRVSAGDGDVLDVKVFEDTQDILLIGKQ